MTESHPPDNLIKVVSALLRRRRPILRTVLAVGLATALISFGLLDDFYQATTIFHVASPDVFKPEQIFGLSTKDMEYFGTELDNDRILTIAQSTPVAEMLIQKFDLYKHYKIDTTHRLAAFKVRETLGKLYVVQKTKNNAIEISVEDKDRKLAAEMANAARTKIDAIAQRQIKETQEKLIRTYDESFKLKEVELAKISDTLSGLRQKYGVYDLETQTEGMTRVTSQATSNYTFAKAKLTELEKIPDISKDTLAQLRATVRAYEAEMKLGMSNLSRYNEGMNGVALFYQKYKRGREQLSLDQERFIQLKTAYGSQISALHISEVAEVPVQKSRPKRSILILTAMLMTFLFCTIGALLLDEYKDVDWKSML
jgi:capsule polysaccharide export protein KpsE/RkpR